MQDGNRTGLLVVDRQAALGQQRDVVLEAQPDLNLQRDDRDGDRGDYGRRSRKP